KRSIRTSRRKVLFFPCEIIIHLVHGFDTALTTDSLRMSVHYKFKSAVEYDTLPVDGLNISLADLKEAIILQKRLGKSQPYDLQITNAETKEVYADEKTLIPKNSSLIVARVPIDPSQMKRGWETKDSTALILANPANIMNTEDAAEAAEIDRKIREVTDLTKMEGSEQDRINAMVAQSTMEFHPSKYLKLRASKMTGSVPAGYRCYKCNQAGHWVTMCPLNNQDLRKSTGIPSMFLEEVEDPTAPGVMISASGKYVRLRNMAGDESNNIVSPPSERPSPPEELECSLCKELLKEAVLIPCCAAAFCDECIRNHLLDSEDHVCPACKKEGVGPDTLIPNRYLRIKVQHFESGYNNAKKGESTSEGSEVLSSVPGHVLQERNTPTPPHSPAHSVSPNKIRLEKQLLTSPVSQASHSPSHTVSPSRVASAEPFGNGEISSDKENILEKEESEEKALEDKDAELVNECALPEHFSDHDPSAAADEKENMELKINEAESDVEERPKKVKKKKSKRKNSRHDTDEENDEKERKKRDRKSSHKSHERKSSEKKSKRHDTELLKDVTDLPEDKLDLWKDDRSVDRHDLDSPKKKKKHHKELVKEPATSGDDQEDRWHSERRSQTRSRTRSRSNSVEKERHDTAPPVVVPFNPLVPPPNFVKSPSASQDYIYPVTSTYVPQVAPLPVTSVSTYPQYQPGLIADPLAEFEKHLREKDEQRARRNRYSRSRSVSRSPRYRRGRSRSRQRTWSRSRSRSISRPRVGGISTHSPRSPSRRRWSRSPPPSGHGTGYHSRSPSFSRDRSLSNRSLSLSRTPSPNRRKFSPLPIHPAHQPVHPEVLLTRPPPPMDYGVPRDYNQYPIASLSQNQYPPPQPGYHPTNTHWDTRYPPVIGDGYKPPFSEQRGRGMRGRGRGRGYRPGDNFGYDQRGQDNRYQYDRRGGGAPIWDRDRPSYSTEMGRSERGNRHSDGDRRRYGDHSGFEDKRPRRDNVENTRRHDDSSYGHTYSSDEEWRRYSDDGKRKDEESDRPRFDGRRREDSASRRLSDPDEYDDYKRNRKDNESRRSYEKNYKDIEDSRSSRHDRDDKHRSTHRDSPRNDDLNYRNKPYDSPGKTHKKSSPRDRRDRDSDRKERDLDKRSKESDRREKDSDRKERDSEKKERERDDRRGKDSDRRDRETDRRERDDRRDRDYEKDSGRRDRDKDYDRKDSYRRDRDQDRKLRDIDRKDERRDWDSSKKEKETLNKDKSERNDDESGRDRDGERAYVSRWDHGDSKARSDKDTDSDRKSLEKGCISEEKEHRRKKHKEEKEEGHHKEKEDVDSEKIEKKKHEKKKKKKEKRRASQASTELSYGEMSGDEGEDKKKKKKRERKKKSKGANAEENHEDNPDDDKLAPNSDLPVDGEASEQGKETGHEAMQTMTSQEKTPESEPKEDNPETLLPLPPLSKWERDEDLTLTPKGLVENKAPEEERKVTDDILKRAENTIFSGRGLANRKVFLETQKQKDLEEKEKSPTPEWERLETREAKRRGTSIQITISSKTESQIGRPRGGRYQLPSPERSEDIRYPQRTRKSTDAEGKPDKHSKTRKRSQSPAELQNTGKTRRKSEKDDVKEEKLDNTHTESMGNTVENISVDEKAKVEVTGQESTLQKGDESMKEELGIKQEDKPQESTLEGELELPSKADPALQQSKEISDELKKIENPEVCKGIKRPSSPCDELEVKKLKAEETVSTSTGESLSADGSMGYKTENMEYEIPVLGKISMKEVTKSEPLIHANSNLVQIPVKSDHLNSNIIQVPLSSGKGEDVEEGEITTDSTGEGERENAVAENKPSAEETITVRGSIQSKVTEKPNQSVVPKISSPVPLPTPSQPEKLREISKLKEKSKKKKKRKHSSSSSSSNSSSSSSSSSSSEDEEIVKKKKKKKKKKKAVDSDSSEGESQKKHKKKKKEKKKKRKKDKKKKSDK
ncbi:hypothetical protein SK128_025024, partial [Halocaridina rubra]